MDPSSYRLLYLAAQAAQDQTMMVLTLLSFLLAGAWLAVPILPVSMQNANRWLVVAIITAYSIIMIAFSEGLIK
jgi:hypothetical protein